MDCTLPVSTVPTAPVATGRESPVGPVLAKLRLHSLHSRAAEQAVEAVVSASLRTVAARRDLFRAGDRPLGGYILVEGWAVRHKSLPDGRRQLTTLLLPGDVFDLHACLAREVDDTVTAITDLTVALLAKEDLERLTAAWPSLTQALLWEQLVGTAIDREWLLNLGQRDATERVSHLLCEIVVRLRIVGLVRDRRCDLPLTQAHIAEMTGLTPVHVNRVLKNLRSEGLIVLSRRGLMVPDLRRLMKRALFDPAYLHLEGQEALAVV
jgi:CRP-like cAMP-binding protein